MALIPASAERRTSLGTRRMLAVPARSAASPRGFGSAGAMCSRNSFISCGTLVPGASRARRFSTVVSGAATLPRLGMHAVAFDEPSDPAAGAPVVGETTSRRAVHRENRPGRQHLGSVVCLTAHAEHGASSLDCRQCDRSNCSDPANCSESTMQVLYMVRSPAEGSATSTALSSVVPGRRLVAVPLDGTDDVDL